MIKKWITCLAIYGLCSIAAPALALAESQNDAYLLESQATATEGDSKDGQEPENPNGPNQPDNPDKPDEPAKPDPNRLIYQAKESKNAQGLIVIENPRWEANKAKTTYRLLKTKTAKGEITYYKSDDGVVQLGAKNGSYYLFDKNGNIRTGCLTVNKARYYFTPKSKAAKTKTAYTPNGTTWGMAVKNAWRKSGKSWYYFNSIGRHDQSKKGLQKINGSYYYLDSKFVPCASKWVKQKNGAWQYFNKDGKYNSKRIGSQKIGGSYYFLNKKGIPYKSCFKTVKKKKYYYLSSGKRANYTGWKTINKQKRYFNAKHYLEVKPGWQLIGGKYYYFGPKGGMVAKKWSTIGGKRYYFKSNGQMATGWTKIGGTYYYFNGSGTLDGSTIAKQGTKYYFVTPQGTRGANILDGVGVTAAMNSGTKLQVCFNYVVRNCRYMGGPVWPPRGWEPYHAYKMLTTRYGNCYDFAAAFCYLAKAVGYESMTCIAGQCASASGGLTPHSWCEFNGMVFDPEISYANGLYLFNVSYGNLPFAYVR